MFCIFTSALPAVCVQCPLWLFFFFLQFLNFVLSRYVVQVLFWETLRWFKSPLLSPVPLLFLHSTCAGFLLLGLYVLESSRLLSVSWITTTIHIHVPFLLSRFITSALLLWTVLLVCPSWFYNIANFPWRLVSTNFDTCSYRIHCQILTLFAGLC